jgi:phospholipase/carboxylesterase
VSLRHQHVPAKDGAPTLLLLHGRGGSAGDLLSILPVLDDRLGALAPQGPVPQPPGWAWFAHERIGVPVVDDLIARRTELSAWLEAAMAEHGIPAPIPAVGFSNGGMMAGAILDARPDLVAGAALLSSGYPLPDETVVGGLDGRPVLILAGDRDPFHPLEIFELGRRWYADRGAQVEARLTPGAGHEITMDQIDALRDWLGRWTGGGGGGAA